MESLTQSEIPYHVRSSLQGMTGEVFPRCKE